MLMASTSHHNGSGIYAKKFSVLSLYTVQFYFYWAKTLVLGLQIFITAMKGMFLQKGFDVGN